MSILLRPARPLNREGRNKGDAVICGAQAFPARASPQGITWVYHVRLRETGCFPSFVFPNQLRFTNGAQARNLPIVKGGSPPKKRQISSLPPFARHLKYAPRSGSDPIRACGIKLPPSFERLSPTALTRYVSIVGRSDCSAVNPGIFISRLSFSALQS